MPAINPRFRAAWSLLVTVVVALVALLGGTPVWAGQSDGSSDSAAHAAEHAGGDGHLEMRGDTVAPKANARAGSTKWSGNKIRYYETVPAKWDWSLSTAVAKWNASGSKITFVRTTSKSRANVTIGYGNTKGAAGLATVGRTPKAWVHLSKTYDKVDALDAWYRVEVMGIFAHELGHVLGFTHTANGCTLMSPVLDVAGCGMFTPSSPGWYRCRTVDATLAARLVRSYGGKARLAANSPCLVDPMPSTLDASLEADGRGAATVSWESPSFAPAGSRVEIQHWSGSACDEPADGVATDYSDPSALAWQNRSEATDTCFQARLVNRYGVARSVTGQNLFRATVAAVAPDAAPTDASPASPEAQPGS